MGFFVRKGLHEGDGWIRFSGFEFGKTLKLSKKNLMVFHNSAFTLLKYHFQGIDMHALTGWIPERISIKKDWSNSDANLVFDKLFKRFFFCKLL